MLVLILALLSLAAPTPATLDKIPELASDALDGDATAIAKLRSLGQPGLTKLVELRKSISSAPPLFSLLPTPATFKWEALVDAVARQKYASASGLYWHTDLDEAKRTAKKEGKPILSLRMLGDLGDDLSCANSRFFRTILYPDPVIATALREGWVLHWESVHDVPVVEIDFGGGKKLRRTITGNSLHYAMTADGEVTEVMPGMVGPQVFAAWLASAGTFTRDVAALASPRRAVLIRAHFEADLATRLETWQRTLALVGVAAERRPEALRAMTTPDAITRMARMRRPQISAEAGMLVGPMMPGAGTLEAGTIAAERAMPLAISKMAVERPMLRQFGAVEGKLAEDEVQNELVLRTQLAAIALGRADAFGAAGVVGLTDAIYRDAFLTPLDDPWMGMAPADVFTALPPAVEKPDTAAR